MKSHNKLVIRQIQGAIRAITDGFKGRGLVSAPHSNHDQYSRRTTQSWAKAYVRALFPYVTELALNPSTRRRQEDDDESGAAESPDPNFDLGPNQVLVLNREYKPLGVAAEFPRVTYSEWPCVVDLPPDSHYKRGAFGTDRVHPLYQNNCTPWSSMVHWRAYAERLTGLLVDLGASQVVLDDLGELTRAWTDVNAGRRRV